MLKKILLPLLFTNFLFAQETIENKPMTSEYLIDQTLLKVEMKRIKIPSYSKRELELLENNWNLVSIKDFNSDHIDLLDNSIYKINFNKNTFKFFANLGCYNFSGNFKLDNDKLDLYFGSSNLLACLHLPTQLITTYSKTLGKEINVRETNPNEILYQQQTELIKNIINNVIGYEINDAELILVTHDSRKLYFKKIIN